MMKIKEIDLKSVKRIRYLLEVINDMNGNEEDKKILNSMIIYLDDLIDEYFLRLRDEKLYDTMENMKNVIESLLIKFYIGSMSVDNEKDVKMFKEYIKKYVKIHEEFYNKIEIEKEEE